MKALLVYDSMYGNTEKLAQAMLKGFSAKDKVEVLKVSEVKITDLGLVDLLVVGCPTQGGRPTVPVAEFIKQISDNGLTKIKVAAFDTRFLEIEQNFGLRLLMKTIGYAADKIANSLKSKGGKMMVAPEGFIVEGKGGPLRKGELDRAAEWIRKMIKE